MQAGELTAGRLYNILNSQIEIPAPAPHLIASGDTSGAGDIGPGGHCCT